MKQITQISTTNTAKKYMDVIINVTARENIRHKGFVAFGYSTSLTISANLLSLLPFLFLVVIILFLIALALLVLDFMLHFREITSETFAFCLIFWILKRINPLNSL